MSKYRINPDSHYDDEELQEVIGDLPRSFEEDWLRIVAPYDHEMEECDQRCADWPHCICEDPVEEEYMGMELPELFESARIEDAFYDDD